MAAFEIKPVGIIAEKEFRERLRNRWVLAVAVIFTFFALVIAYFGSAQQGEVGFMRIDVTIASLVSLAIYLVPLIALILGFDAIVGERERGSLDLVLSLPITRLELLLGKFFGLSAALAFSTVAGFGLVGILLAYQMDLASLWHYAGFVLSALLMGMAFLSIALMVSAVSTNKTIASGVAIALWFFFVLVYDLVLVGLLVAAEGQVVGAAMPLLLMLNPADVFRILNVFSMQELQVMYGLATTFPRALASPLLLAGVMFLWIVAPLGVAYYRFRQSGGQP